MDAECLDFHDQNYEELRGGQSSDNLFEDPDFEPTDDVLLLGHQNGEIVWKRPNDICSNPKFIVGGGSRFDACQGGLGDCWFVTAMASLAEKQEVFEQVIQKDVNAEFSSEDYAGIFVFQLWHDGQWYKVVIDDFLPCNGDNPIYTKFVPDDNGECEFWPALLEKAYAKLHGSYRVLVAGYMLDAAMDFTGGTGESINLIEMDPETIFNTLLKAHRSHSFLFACTGGGDDTQKVEGIAQRHAYSITNVDDVLTESGERVHLLRIRNPWGTGLEWKGDWSDGSEKWDDVGQAEKDNLGFTEKVDGEFFISADDFVTRFAMAQVCYYRFRQFGEDYWHREEIEGEWLFDINAGGSLKPDDPESFATNSQFKVVFSDSDKDSDNQCSCVIELFRKGSRNQLGSTKVAIGFYVYQIEDEADLPMSQEFMVERMEEIVRGCGRQISRRFKFEPGTYVIVPCTVEKDHQAEFILRVVAEQLSPIEKIK